MDPYLEAHWGDVHHSLVQYARDALQPGLPPALVARVEERVFVEREAGTGRRVIPDVRIAQLHRTSSGPMELREGGTAVAEPEVFEVLEEEIAEGYLEIRERDGSRVITVIEFLSPANKAGGVGQQKYLEKQGQVLHSDASLVEIDLVRSGQCVLALAPNQPPLASPFEHLACISPGWRRTRRELYRMPLRERLPALPIPLRQHDARFILELRSLVDLAYAAGRYDVLDYSADPDPPLPPADAAWAADLLRRAGRGRIVKP